MEVDGDVRRVMDGLISKVESRKKVAYVFNPELLQLVDKLPKIKSRVRRLINFLFDLNFFCHQIIS